MEIVWSEEENRDVVINPCCNSVDILFKEHSNIDMSDINFCPWCGTKIDKEGHEDI